MHKSLIIVLNQTLVGLLCWNLRKNTEEDLVLFSKEYQNTLLSVILIWRFNLVLKVTKKIQIWKLRMIFLCFFFWKKVYLNPCICACMYLNFLCFIYVCYTHVCTWLCLCLVYTWVRTCGKLMSIYVWYIYAYVHICGVCTMFLCMRIGGCILRVQSEVDIWCSCFSLPALGLQAPIPIIKRDAGESRSGPHTTFYSLNCFCHSISGILSLCPFKIDVTLYSVLKVTVLNVTITCVSFICHCSSRQIIIPAPNFNNLELDLCQKWNLLL